MVLPGALWRLPVRGMIVRFPGGCARLQDGDSFLPPADAIPRVRRTGIACAALIILSVCSALAPTASPAVQLEKLRDLSVQTPKSTVVKFPHVTLTIPSIASVAPAGCVKTGTTVTLTGANFGAPKPAGYSLAIQVGTSPAVPVTESNWSSTSIAFGVPSGLAAGSTFKAGILSGGAFIASTQLTTCAATPSIKVSTAQKLGDKVIQGKVFEKVPIPVPVDAGNQPADPGGPPELTSISPPDCVNAGVLATATGVNLGSSKQSSGLSLGIQIDDGPFSEVMESSWSMSSVSFVVPSAALLTGWFALGFIYQGEFYAQLYVLSCEGYSGGDGFTYEGGSYEDYGSYDAGVSDAGSSTVAAPKGARMLNSGAVDVAIPPAPVPEAPVVEPPAPGQRVVGGKLLAMKALVRRGLYKVNKECDLYDPHCACCRKDDSVCLEKESENEDGSSTWAVRWKAGAKTADGRGVYAARSAEEDVESVTELRCEPIGGGAGSSAGLARVKCR